MSLSLDLFKSRIELGSQLCVLLAEFESVLDGIFEQFAVARLHAVLLLVEVGAVVAEDLSRHNANQSSQSKAQQR